MADWGCSEPSPALSPMRVCTVSVHVHVYAYVLVYVCKCGTDCVCVCGVCFQCNSPVSGNGFTAHNPATPHCCQLRCLCTVLLV